MDAFTLVLAATSVAGLYMAWNIGANDVANAMGTSVGSGALSLRSALIIAAIFELAGALFAGGPVSTTIAHGIIDTDALDVSPIVLAGGMACSLVAAALWIHSASALGYPVSTTHSIVGAVFGFGLAIGGAKHTDWAVLSGIVVSWILSPLLGAAAAFTLYRIVQRSVFEARDARVAANRFAGLAVFTITTVCAGLILDESYFLHALIPGIPSFALSAVIGGTAAAVVVGGFFVIAHMRALGEPTDRQVSPRQHAELVFGALQVITACFIAFAHGSNDVANAAGPIAAAFHALSGISTTETIPTNVLMIGACGIVLGLATYGFRVMATIGREITQLTPSRGFAAETAAAVVIVVCSRFALPVSTTSVLVGAVVGVGLHRTLEALNLRVLRRIGVSWVVAVPITATLSAILTGMLRYLVSP